MQFTVVSEFSILPKKYIFEKNCHKVVIWKIVGFDIVSGLDWSIHIFQLVVTLVMHLVASTKNVFIKVIAFKRSQFPKRSQLVLRKILAKYCRVTKQRPWRSKMGHNCKGEGSITIKPNHFSSRILWTEYIVWSVLLYW